MRTERLTESQVSTLTLTEDEADQLRKLGRDLASSKNWWGSEHEDQTRQRAVIRCERIGPSRYEVRVVDAIGAVGLGDLQLLVEPKIPITHLTYILNESGQLPRIADGRAELETDANFFVLVALWFIGACEVLLQHDLIRDYTPVTEDRPAARGRVHAIPTFKSLLHGRPAVRCSYDELTTDNPLNRVIAAASRVVIANAALPRELRKRARRIELRLGNVGQLTHNDLRYAPTARSIHYKDAHALAKSVIFGHGTSPSSGSKTAWTFLFRTPEPVEEGIRQILKTGLSPTWEVRKKGKALAGASPRTLNPDLVFGNDDAIGDVKYRLSSGKIETSHLYQLTSFAAGYRSRHGLLIDFGPDSGSDHVEIGSIRVAAASWDIELQDPSSAAEKLCAQVERWLSSEVTA